MAVGIIIHISVGEEKRTEFFSEDRLSIGRMIPAISRSKPAKLPQKASGSSLKTLMAFTALPNSTHRFSFKLKWPGPSADSSVSWTATF